MSKREYLRRSEADVVKAGYSFFENQHNGSVFSKMMDGMVHKVLVQPDGIVRKYLPFTPNPREKELYG
jgi:hypothetical protein